VIVRLQTMHPGEMLTDYGAGLIGKAGTALITIYYILYLLLIVVFLVTQLVFILQTQFMPETPKWVNILIGIPVFLFVAYKGITNVARLFEIMGMMFLTASIFIHILMLLQSDILRILPVFDPAEMGNYLSAVKDMIFPFLGMELLLAIPFTKENAKKKAVKKAFYTIIGIGLFYILVVESSIMRVGIHDIVHYKAALIIAIREMEVPFLDFLQRMDLLYLTVGFLGFFMGIVMVFMVILEYLCRLFKNISRIKITIFTGVISFIFSAIACDMQGFPDFVQQAGIYLGLVASILIPALLLMISKVKKNGKKSV